MTRRLCIQGPAGRLDARIHGEDGGPPVLVLHPHPLLGGSKATRLVYTLCRGLAEAGMQAWRFDFRGAGDSEGAYDEGRGETEDAVAVWDHIRSATGQPAAALGFSFGGGVAARLATVRPVPHVVLVATPPKMPDTVLTPAHDLARTEAPVDMVWGTEDPHVPRQAVEGLQTSVPRLRIRPVAGAGHFLEPRHHPEVVRHVVEALQT